LRNNRTQVHKGDADNEQLADHSNATQKSTISHLQTKTL